MVAVMTSSPRQKDQSLGSFPNAPRFGLRNTPSWSGSRCPSSIRLSFCSASSRNTSPKYFRNSPYNAFRRPFGINTTWHLHSPFEWLKLSYSSIQFLLCVCFAAHAWSFLDGLPYLSNFACLPGRAGGTPISLGTNWRRLRRPLKTLASLTLSRPAPREAPALALTGFYSKSTRKLFSLLISLPRGQVYRKA